MGKRKVVRIPVINRKQTKPDDEAENVPDTEEEEDEVTDLESIANSHEEIPEIDIDWYDRALRLQAEMANYRRRQQKLADDRVTQARADLLRNFLGVLDNMERIIAHLNPDDVHAQSIRSTYDQMLHVLHAAGVDTMSTVGEPFDPEWHEAVAMVTAPDEQNIEMLVVKEEQRGYRLGDQMLRPARVVVAKKE